MQMPETGRVTLRNVQQQSLNLSARHLAWKKEIRGLCKPPPHCSHRAGSHRLASVGRLVGWLDCWSAAPGLAPGLAPAVWLTPGGTGIGTGCIGRSRLAPGLAPAGIASAGIGCIGRSHAHTRAPACTAARPPAQPQPQPQVSLDKEREDSKARQATQIVVQGSLFWRSKSHRRFGRVPRRDGSVLPLVVPELVLPVLGQILG